MHHCPPLSGPFFPLSPCSGSAISIKAKGLFQFTRIAFSEVGCVSGWYAENRCQFWAPSDSFLRFIYCTSVLRCQVVWSKRLKNAIFFGLDAISEHLGWILSYVRTFKHSVHSEHLPLAFSFKWNRFTQLSKITIITQCQDSRLQQLDICLCFWWADGTATACRSASWNHFSLPDHDAVSVKFIIFVSVKVGGGDRV